MDAAQALADGDVTEVGRLMSASLESLRDDYEVSGRELDAMVYEVIERFRAFTYIKVKLETGRTHQIRVHFAWRRHALVGDQTYGGRLALPAGATEALIETLRRFKRQALHATRLAFEHPGSGEVVELEVPPPADFDDLLTVLREDMSQ